jgi:hypothetical protein
MGGRAMTCKLLSGTWEALFGKPWDVVKEDLPIWCMFSSYNLSIFDCLWLWLHMAHHLLEVDF